jgi:hypothetical protein
VTVGDEDDSSWSRALSSDDAADGVGILWSG